MLDPAEITLEEFIAKYTTPSPSVWELLGKSIKIWAVLMVGVIIISLVIKYKDIIMQLIEAYDEEEYEPQHGGKHRR